MNYIDKKHIDLSIIVCTYNRQEHILNCLTSLRNQDLDTARFEVIVVNDGSTDNTDKLVRQFMNEKGELQFRYELVSPNKGLSHARNFGFQISSGRYISYVDDDAVMPSYFATKVLENFENYPQYSAMGGTIIPVYPHGETDPPWMTPYIWGIVSKVDYGSQFREFPQNKYPSGCNMLFRREALEELGGFDSSLRIRSDDKYIFGKLREKGNKAILFCPNITVRHNIEAERITLSGVMRVSLSVGRSERIRLEGNTFAQYMKLLEYLVKLEASLLLALRYLFVGEGIKAKYLVLVRLKILQAFIQG